MYNIFGLCSKLGTMLFYFYFFLNLQLLQLFSFMKKCLDAQNLHSVLVGNAAINLCHIAKVENNVFPSLGNPIFVRLRSTNVSDYRGCFLYKSVGK